MVLQKKGIATNEAFGVEFIFVRVRGKVGFNFLPTDYWNRAKMSRSK